MREFINAYTIGARGRFVKRPHGASRSPYFMMIL
jgi:hypothetical protein